VAERERWNLRQVDDLARPPGRARSKARRRAREEDARNPLDDAQHRASDQQREQAERQLE
jgi:hypothetical protein